jgi:uncharacterized protein (DUF305 family)
VAQVRSTAAWAAVAVVLIVLMATGCGSADQHGALSSTQTSEQADHNADDIAFAHNMIPHHEQAVQMAQMVPTNTTNPQVIALSNQIIATQAPGVEAFRSFLVQWPDAGSDSAIPMAGMVDTTTMDKLQSLTGPGFDKLWLTSMIAHNSGAIAMAHDEAAHGRNPDVIYLARRIIATQQPEIDQMKKMLGG